MLFLGKKFDLHGQKICFQQHNLHKKVHYLQVTETTTHQKQAHVTSDYLIRISSTQR